MKTAIKTSILRSIQAIYTFLALSSVPLLESAVIDPTSPNDEAILEQLQAITNAEQLLILDELFSLDEEDQLHAINQLAALPYTNLFQMAELSTRQFLRRLYTPLRSIISIRPDERCDCPVPSLIGIWSDVGYNHTSIHPSACFGDYHWKGFDVNLGIQATINPCWTLGIAGSYEHDTIDYQLDAKGKNKTYLAGVYSLVRPADYYFLADIVAGFSNYSVKRSIDIGTSRFNENGRPQTHQGIIYLEAGHDLPFHGCYNTYLFQVFLGLETGYFRYKTLHERLGDSPFSVNVSGRSHVTCNGRLGLHFTTELFSSVSISADAAWQHRCTSFDSHIKARFQEFGDSFSITGSTLSHDSFDGAVNITLALENNVRFFVEADGQVWSNASTYNTFAGIQLGW